tara:strand:- start:975 stop:1340 length:366 start_codon:yes stop_codon:yes gene_type:complete
MEKPEITHKDLSKEELDSLKDLYIDQRINSMSEKDLKGFAKEILDLQIRGTVGNEEEKEVWKEIQDFFKDDFVNKLENILITNNKENSESDIEIDSREKRLELLKKRKEEGVQKKEDMWED